MKRQLEERFFNDWWYEMAWVLIMILLLSYLTIYQQYCINDLEDRLEKLEKSPVEEISP